MTADRLARAGRDLRELLRLKLPAHEAGHEGLAGLVQAVGLIAFLWMAVSGSLMFAYQIGRAHV